MALRDQPYLPLYVQDFLTDEKLAECSAAATGVYIRLMCLMHKSEQYGKILLKQKYKQNDKQILNFAYQVAKNFPYPEQVIADGLQELLDENVLEISGDFLIQKRMVKDAEISHVRAVAGKKGGDKTTTKNKGNFALNFAQAKKQANTEYEIENENDIVIDNKKEKAREKSKPENVEQVVDFMKHEYPNMLIEIVTNQANQYWNHYTANGWKVGRNAMKDWRAAARNWINRKDEFKNTTNGTATTNRKFTDLGPGERVGALSTEAITEYRNRNR